MPTKRPSHTVRVGSVALVLKPWTHPATGRDCWRAAYYGRDGKRRHITRSSLPEAKEAAFSVAKELASGAVDFAALSDSQLRGIRRILDADPELTGVDRYLAWLAKDRPNKPTNEAVAEFLAAKDANAGRSTQNHRTLRKHLQPLADAFGAKSLADITLAEIESHLATNPRNGNRTRRNIRSSIVTFFRWAREREFLPEGKTVIERTAVPIIADTIPCTYTPAELAILLSNVRLEYLPWLATAAFAGVRTDEISPVAGSRKSPLDWSDFHWDRDLIIIRPETAKTKRRRVVPILPALRSWLLPLRKEIGPILTVRAPTKAGRGKGAIAETARLGALIGGWRPNALRHSFISYRAALIGLGQTAMEAGNSEAEARRSYNDAKGADEANEWFGVLKCSQNSESAADSRIVRLAGK